MSFPNAWGLLREREGGGGDGHLFWIVPLMGVGLNSSGDPGRGSSCWGLVLSKEVGLLVGLSGGGGGWFWGESGVGAWTGLEVGVGLNSKGEELWLTDSILLIRGMHGVTESTSLNWLFGVSCMLLMLSSCVWGGGSDSISGDVIGPSV